MIKGILTEGQYDEVLDLLLKVGEVLRCELDKMSLSLIDFKIEIGFDENGKPYVVDEITPGIWRAYDPETKSIPNQIECAVLVLAKIE